MVRQAEAFHTPFHRRISKDIFPQTKARKQERGRHESQEVADPHEEGNKARAPAVVYTWWSHPPRSEWASPGRQWIANIHWITEKAREFQKNIHFCFIDYNKAFDCVDHNKLWKILKEMGLSDRLTCLLRNLYAGQEVTVRTGHGTTGWLQIGKGVHQGCMLSPCSFSLYAEYIMQNSRLDEARAEIKIAAKISITSDMQMTPPSWQKVKMNLRDSW